MAMRSVERTARTVEEAVSEALEELGADRSAVEIEVLDEGSKGLLGIFGARLARVRVTLKSEPAVAVGATADSAEGEDAPTAAGDVPAAEPVPEEKRLTRTEALDKACEFVRGVATRLGIDVDIETREAEDDIVYVDMSGERVGLLIGRHGQTLDAIQYLANVVANRNCTGRLRLVLDVEGYRVRRQATLTHLAERMARKAVEEGRKTVLEPMNALERRVIHMALKDHEAVTTYSEGEEPYRRVVIAPKG
jgi:spoIIIJ-associated protein